MELRTARIWDGKDTLTNEIGEFSLTFAEKEARLGTLFGPIRARRLLRKLEKRIQPIADKQFGDGMVRVRGLRLTKGSIEITFALMVIAGTVYKFFKDYSSLRKGVLEFTADIKNSHEMLEEFLETNPEITPLTSLLSVFSGVAIDQIGTIVASFIAFGIINSTDIIQEMELIIVLATLAVTSLGPVFLGGLVAAHLAECAEAFHASVVGTISVIVGVALFQFAPEFSILTTAPLWFNVLIIGLLLPVATLGGLVAKRWRYLREA